MNVSADDLPAIRGGQPAKTVPYTKQPKFGAEELTQVQEALDQGTLFYYFGKKVSELEKAFAEKLGSKHAVATSSGTASIHAALIAAGVSPGDEVIVSPITDMGSIAPILWQGAVPVFADVHPTRHTTTVDTVRAAITPRTKAIIAVHLWGNPADPAQLRNLADERGITLIEDCAQAYGCKQNGRWAGTIGHMGAFSLNDFKHISAGDGGMVVTDDDELALRLRLATDKGYSRAKDAAERNPVFLCNNYRMTELQGAVGLAQIAKLDSIISRRQQWCAELSRRIAGLPCLIIPEPAPGAEVSWWFYMFRINPEVSQVDADQFVAALQAEQVPAAAHYIGRCVYEYPIFLNHSAFDNGQHPYTAIEYRKGMCPAAEELLRHCLILPINEGYTAQDLEETVKAFERVCVWACQKHPLL